MSHIQLTSSGLYATVTVPPYKNSSVYSSLLYLNLLTFNPTLPNTPVVLGRSVNNKSFFDTCIRLAPICFKIPIPYVIGMGKNVLI